MRTVIEGSNNSVSALSPQTLGGTDYAWSSWSDEGTQPHNILASASATYTAAYQAVQSADLVVAKTGALNGVATWTLSVSNQGPGAAEGVAVTDTLPSRVSYVSAPGCTYNPSTRTVHCNAGSLAQSGTASFTITTTAPNKGNGWVINTGQVSSSTPDPNTANNTAGTRVRRCRLKACSAKVRPLGRVAQRESARFTRGRSLVRSQSRPTRNPLETAGFSHRRVCRAVQGARVWKRFWNVTGAPLVLQRFA
jgi:uncharacterized repeat protein (TIGR01451 family)